MTDTAPPDPQIDQHGGLQAVFLAHRTDLARFLSAHGAAEAVEDLLQELWLKVASGAAAGGPVAQPLSYLYRAANNLMIDRYRSRRQAERRERDWSEASDAAEPMRSEERDAERELLGREALAGARAALAALGPRPAAVFYAYRLDGVAQRDIARQMGVSLSTVESDLRKAYRALIDYRRTLDEA